MDSKWSPIRFFLYPLLTYNTSMLSQIDATQGFVGRLEKMSHPKPRVTEFLMKKIQ